VIDILSGLCQLQLGPILHSFCFEFGAELSAVLRQQWAELGDVQILEMIAALWSGLLSINNETEAFFEAPFADRLGDILTEFFEAGQILALSVAEFDSPTEWVPFFQAAMKMTQCFSECEDQSFIGRVFDLFIAVLNAGVCIVPDQCDIKAAFHSSREFLAGYLAEKPPSPGLLIVARDLSTKFPPELLQRFCAQLPAFAALSPAEVVLDFIAAAAVHDVEPHLDLLLALVVGEFEARPHAAALPLARLCQRFHTQIMASAHGVLDLLRGVLLAGLDENPFFLVCLSYAFLVLDAPDPGRRLTFLGAVAILALQEGQWPPATMIALFARMIGILAPSFRQFCAKLAQDFFSLCSPFWGDPDLHEILAQMVRDCLRHGLLAPELAAATARWVDAAIVQFAYPVYIECLPYLAEYAPLDNVRLFLAQFDPQGQPRLFPIVQAIVGTLRVMIKKFGERTWEFIPIQLVIRCLETRRFEQAFVDLVGDFLPMFPPQVVLAVLRESQETRPQLFAKLMPRIPHGYVDHLLALEAQFATREALTVR
jgi:hypothetical protein